jgi:hypothetical protein
MHTQTHGGGYTRSRGDEAPGGADNDRGITMQEITLDEYEAAETTMRAFEAQREEAGREAFEAEVATQKLSAATIERATFEGLAAQVRRGIADIQDALAGFEAEQFDTIGGVSLADLAAESEQEHAKA